VTPVKLEIKRVESTRLTTACQSAITCDS